MEKTNNENKTIVLGSSVRVSDPCYGTDVWCATVVKNVRPGEYDVEIETSDEGMWGKRVKSLTIGFKDYKGILLFNDVLAAEIGVDSGQCGFYDEEYYKQYHTSDDVDDKWYEEVCDLTNPFGTKDNKCVVSSSGYGDGSYSCLVARDKDGYVVGLSLEYISDEDEEYEDDDDYYDDEEDNDEYYD